MWLWEDLHSTILPFAPLSPSLPPSLSPSPSPSLSLQVVRFEKEIKEASKRNFRLRVEHLKKDIEQHTIAKKSQEEKIEECSKLLKEIRNELSSVDQRISSLASGLKLDTLENRCMWKWGSMNMHVCSSLLFSLSFFLFLSFPSASLSLFLLSLLYSSLYMY